MRISYWQCQKCHGSGKAIPVPGHVERCFECDGTGNALVDGRAAAHAREVRRIETDKAASSIKPFVTTRAHG